jgi:hypothetical protein
MSIQILVTCFAVSLAVTKANTGNRARNAWLATGAAALATVIESALLGDWLRAAILAPTFAALAFGGVHAGYFWIDRSARRQ